MSFMCCHRLVKTFLYGELLLLSLSFISLKLIRYNELWQVIFEEHKYCLVVKFELIICFIQFALSV